VFFRYICITQLAVWQENTVILRAASSATRYITAGMGGNASARCLPMWPTHRPLSNSRIAMIDHYCKLEPSDYTDFQRLKRQHPEQVLQFIEDYRTDEPSDTSNQPKEKQIIVSSRDSSRVIEEMLQQGYLYNGLVLIDPNTNKEILSFKKP